MAGINVLSETLKGGSKLEKTPTSKGKGVAESSETAATGFAAVLSGSINLNADPKGQNSKAGKDSEKKQSTVETVPSSQNPNGLGSMLGYVNFALPFLTQMLQSDLPAGKEANSGNNVSQGTKTMASLLSLVSDGVSAQSGMTAQKSQGGNPAITELDNYRQVIGNFLAALSGEITDVSPKGMSLGAESAETNSLSQGMAKVVQGWTTMAGDVAKGDTVLSGQATLLNSLGTKLLSLMDVLSGAMTSSKGSLLSAESAVTNSSSQDIAKVVQGISDPALKAEVSTLLETFSSLLSQASDGGVKTSQGMKATMPAESDQLDQIYSLEPRAKGSSDPLMKQLKGTDQQKPEGMSIQETKTAKVLQGTSSTEAQKVENTKFAEISGAKDVQNQNSSAGIGVASTIVAANVADGKTTAVPVWEQISTVLREQVMNKAQDLKQLDIQLHPADLGKIQIDVRWENGQVHLQVQASQAATGQLLQNHLSDLRQALSNQGVNCGTLHMGQGGAQQQNPQGDESRRTLNQNALSNEEEDIVSGTIPLSMGQIGNNLINVTA